MATHNVYIYATSKKPYPLAISDDEGNISYTDQGDKALETIVNEGDTIIWNIHPKSDITSIDNIDFVNPTIFIEGGSKTIKDKPNIWSCEIKSIQGTSTVWTDYNIRYTVNGLPFIQDPKLQIRKKDLKTS